MSPRARCRRETRPPSLWPFSRLLVLSGCSSIGDFGRLSDPRGHRRHSCLGRRGSRGQRRRADLRRQSHRRRTHAARSRLSADRAALRPAALGCGGLRIRHQAIVPARIVELRSDGLLPASAGRTAALERGALQSVDRRHPQRHRADRAVFHGGADASSISTGGARRAWSRFANLTPAERVNAQARIGENSLTIAWVDKSLDQRCASYRFALEHLAVAEPQPVAGDADRVLPNCSSRSRPTTCSGRGAALCLRLGAGRGRHAPSLR